MAYGTSATKYFRPSFELRTSYPGFSKTETVSSNTNLVLERWSRSGTDRNTTQRKRKKFNTFYYKKTKVLVPYFKKLRISDRNGKVRTIRVQLYRYKVMRVKTPILASRTKENLMVNDLTYTSERLKLNDSSGVFCFAPKDNYLFSGGRTWNIRGPLAFIDISSPSWFGGSSDFVWRGFMPDSYGATYLKQDNLATISELTAAVTTAIYEKVKSQETNVGNLLAELGKTKQSFADIVVRIASALLSFKSGNFIKGFRKLLPGTPKEVANDYLLWTYGIKPLLGDIDGLAKHLAAVDKLEVVDKAVRSRNLASPIQNKVFGGRVMSRTETLGIETEVTVKAVIKYRIDCAKARELNQLGLTNPASVAWETVPWSFVVDWLIPIGNWLNLLDTMLTVTPVSYHTTVVVKQKIFCTSTHSGEKKQTSSDRGITTFGGVGSWAKENVYVERRLASVPALPYPKFKNPVSQGHIQNALALLTQAFSKR